jgi:hypothetical protein
MNMPNNGNKEVVVRMYKQGLGDCFLLTFPRPSGQFHMLLDCGALNSKHYDKTLMVRVVEDIHARTGGRLDVVAATHEHWDHISGFYQAKDVFKTFKVGEVWAAWTEEKNNPAARRLKERFKKEKKAVQMALTRLPDTEHDKQLGLYKKSIGELFGFFGGLGAGARADLTGQAWDIFLGLGRKFYCDPKARPVELEEIGARVYVLGPPEDPDFIKKRLSKKETYEGAEHGFTLADSFLAAVNDDEDAEPHARERALPFDKRHCIPVAEAKKFKFFKERYGFGTTGPERWRRIDHDWLNLVGELALHLDSYTNNTCLAFAVELVDSGKVLLFPGDAQVGNWLSWGELSWKVKEPGGGMRTVDVNDLLARTVLYKVGHHGSHNATLRTKGLEMMESPDLVAMIPVHRKTAQDQKWEFPYSHLWERLKVKTRGRVLLADAKGLQEIESEAKEMLSNAEWDAFRRATSINPLFIEHRIPY